MRTFRFGLPFSLAEALRAEKTPIAQELAELIGATEATPSAPAAAQTRRDRVHSACLALALFLGAGVASGGLAHAGNLEGRWIMAPQGSSFEERVTGPAPDAATVVVTRDDPERLAYELTESRRGEPTAHAAYSVSFRGQASSSRTDGRALEVAGARDARGDVEVRAPRVGAFQALIRVRRTGEDTATLEHAIEGPGGVQTLERLALVRSGQQGKADTRGLSRGDGRTLRAN